MLKYKRGQIHRITIDETGNLNLYLNGVNIYTQSGVPTGDYTFYIASLTLCSKPFENLIMLRPSADIDCDGVINFEDLDKDNYGIINTTECTLTSLADAKNVEERTYNFDFDNVPFLGYNDGIPDAVEACGNINLTLEDCMLDSDGSASYPDYNSDGCPDGIVSSYCTNAPIDTNDDGTPDFIDLDSDNDGCADSREAGTDSYFGTNALTFNNPSSPTENCGLVISAQQGVCEIPENSDWLSAAEINVCNPECDILDPNADCDNDGVINIFDCAPNDDTNIDLNYKSNCSNNISIFNFGN